MSQVESGVVLDYQNLRLPLKDVPYVYHREDSFQPEHRLLPTEYPRQLYLQNLPDGLIPPAEFQRRYESETGSLLYSVSTRYEKESGEMVPDGIGMVVASHDILSETGDIIRQESLHIGYDQGTVNYVSSIITDVASLRAHYAARNEPLSSPQTLSLSHDGIDEHADTQRVSESDEQVLIDLIFSRVQSDTDQVLERGERVTAPLHLNAELSHLLMAEGKNRLGSDSDRSNNGEVGEIVFDSDESLYQVPKKFPVTFTPFESTLVKKS